MSRGALTGTEVPYATAHVPRLLLEWPREHGDARHASIEGTTVFADISGFTKLSERLARLGGKAGAEQIAGVITDVFNDLLTVVAARGGEMLKFGGDAVLLLFRGEHHPQRAAAACIEMQAALASFKLPEIPGRPVRLRMSMGAHTGSFDMFVVGESHRDLVVAGPATTITVGLEAAASAGEVLVSDALAVAIGEQHVGRARSEGQLLRTAPQAPLSDPRPREEDPAALECIPIGYRRHLVEGRLELAHRLATVSFVHLGGLDGVLASRGPQAAADALARTFSVVSSSFDRYGVCLLASDVYEDGTKMIAVAGAPETVEEPERRMLVALRDVLDQDLPLPVRAGVHLGHVFAGEVGPPFRRTYTIIGDVVNTAARVAAHAKPRELLTLAEVLEAAGTGIDVEPRPPFAAKGKTEPLQPLLVRALEQHRAEAETEARPTAHSTPLVGRNLELVTLVGALQDAAAGTGSALRILGDVGMGKTRLVEEALACGPEEMQVFRLRCEPYEKHTPWFPVRHLLAAVVGHPGQRGPVVVEALEAKLAAEEPRLLPWLPLLASVLDVVLPDTPETAALDQHFRRSRTVAVVNDLLQTLQRQQPTTFFFDDLHYADEATLELIHELVATISERSWLLLATSRDEVPTRVVTSSDDATVVLEPLPDDAIEILLKDPSVEPPLTPRDRDLFVTRAGGIPLFVTAMLRARANGEDEIPDSVEAVMALGIDGFTADERRLLRAAAVLGTTFERSFLKAVLEATDIDPAIADRPSLQAVLAPVGTDELAFRHHLMRDVAYETMPFRERRELHDRAASELRARLGDVVDDRVGLLSLHLERAGRLEDVWHFARRAAERAGRKHAHCEAVELWDRALAAASKLGVSGAELASAYEELADSARWTDAPDRTRRAYRRARREAKSDPTRYARLCRKQSMLHVDRSGNITSALRWAQRGARGLDELDGPDARYERAALFCQIAHLLLLAGKPGRALTVARRAVAEASEARAEEVEAIGYVALDRALVALGRRHEATHADAARALFQRTGNKGDEAVVVNNQGNVRQSSGAWDDAITCFEAGRELFEASGNLVNAGFGALNVAEIRCDQGRVREAAQLCDEASTLWRSIHHEVGLLFADGMRGRVLLRSGRYQEAREHLDRLCDTLHARGLAGVAGLFDPARIECAIAQGDDTGASDLLAAVARGAGTVSSPAAARLQACLHLLRGDQEAATAAVAVAVAEARAAEDPFELARCLQVSALLAGDGTEADGARAEIAALFEMLGVVAPPVVPGVHPQPVG